MKPTTYTDFARTIDDAIKLLVERYNASIRDRVEWYNELDRRYMWLNEKLGSVVDDVFAFELEEMADECRRELDDLVRSTRAEREALDAVMASAALAIEEFEHNYPVEGL